VAQRKHDATLAPVSKLKKLDASSLGRPIVYLDQNLLGEPLEKLINSERYVSWKKNVIIAYSDDTIAEILRAKGLATRFLNNLEQFDTVRIYHELENFRQTGRHIARFERPRDRLNEIVSDGLLASTELLGVGILHKMFGGQGHLSLAEIVDEQVKSLKESWLSNIDEIGLAPSEVEALTNLFLGLLKSGLSDFAEQTRVLGDALNPDGTETSVLDFRRELNLDPVSLNAIDGKDAVEKIWRLVKSSSDSYKNKSIEEFFSIQGDNPYTGAPYTTQEKVRSVMLILNVIGFHSDKKLRKTERFTASMSDLGHSVWGSLCTAIATKDTGFRQRLQAAYAFLEIPTLIYDVDTSEGFVLF
jgi:hypothetical protein